MRNLPYPNATDLSERYRQLEGFTDTELVCRTDCSKADLTVLTTADFLIAVEKRSGDSLSDVLISFIVILGLLLASSVTLGLAASQLTVVVKQLTHYGTQARLEQSINSTIF